jgi:SAM-dependent methyltransferase
MREFLAEAGYSEENLRGAMEMKDLPSSRLRNYARLLDMTNEPNCINTLVRWFWIGEPQDVAKAKAYVPDWFVHLALQCGLLYRQEDKLAPEAMLFPANDFLFAADHTRKIDAADSSLVLWPNPTSRLLSRFTVRRRSRATLDLGTGTGIQAMLASSHSDTVVATDLNARAVAFAAFNASLNGIGNVEFLLGNGFEPVAGSKFDLIVSNPPFFISPSAQYLFCDNPLDLDQLCQRLAREAPEHLNEHGYFEMMCEWAEIQGQSWQDRLAGWFEGTGCDVWGLRGYVEDPGEYALERIRAISPSPAQDAELYENYMAYYRTRNIKAIHGGLIAMRRKAGHNWIYLEEVRNTPKEPFGDLVLQRFAVQDFLRSHGADSDLMDLKPKLAADVRLEQVFQQIEGGWKRETISLKQKKGLDPYLVLDPVVAEFLSGFDGVRTVGEVITGFTGKVDAHPEQVRKECIEAVRKLIERGFLEGLPQPAAIGDSYSSSSAC